jgi:hypothetical protein
MKNLLLTASSLAAGICVAAMTPQSASAQCNYRMNDIGRPHGYLSGPCNGAAQGYSGAYPSCRSATNHRLRKTVHQRPTTVTRFAKRSVKQLGSEVGSRAWKPAMRSGLGLMLMGLLGSARQQIAQGSQGSPSSQAVDDKK